MEVHRQQCQVCRSFEMKNLLVRDVDRPVTVYVRCGMCGEMVAMYELSQYYHHGKGLESYLKDHAASSDSGRQWLAEFNRVQEASVYGYNAAMEQLPGEGKNL